VASKLLLLLGDVSKVMLLIMLLGPGTAIGPDDLYAEWQ
jgi:hypothetical protein